jgi:integral membrane protein (TIGR01906 family)
MIKYLQFFSIFISTITFVVASSVMMLATKSFVSLQYALLPGKPDQKILAYQSLEALTSPNTASAAGKLFASINQANELPLFTPQEVSHLIDVKIRFDVVRFAAVITFIVLLAHAYILKSYAFARHMFNASVLAGILVIATGSMLLLAWNWLFITFHEVLFPAGNWSFSPKSGLIQLFPEIFWFRFGVAWIGLILLMLTIFALVSKSIINRSSHI